MSNYPFYKGAAAAAEQVRSGSGATINTGLWFTRFYNRFQPDWSVGDDDKRGWIGDTVAWGASGDGGQIAHLLQRQRALCQALGGQTAELQTQGNFVTGTGLSHPVENGFTFHPVLGMPYLPASGVKGLLRGWVEVWMDHGAQGETGKTALIARWFGTAKGGGDTETTATKADVECAGSYHFFDALPSKPVGLACDVMTPHMNKWYEKGGDYSAADQASTAPADWHSPVPVPFMVVEPGTSFNFMVAPRLTGNAQADAHTCAELPRLMAELKNALEWLGAGAKTATGYGRMVDQRALDAEKINQGLAQAGIVLGEEVWEGAKLSWDKGKRHLSVTPAPGSGKKVIVTRDATAKDFFDALSDAERKKLTDGKQLSAKVHVKVKGNENTVLRIETAANK